MKEDNLLVEKVYRQARADEFVWQKAKALGVSRQKFLQFMAVGAGIAIGSGLPRLRLEEPALAAQELVKPVPPELFYDYKGIQQEMRWEAMYDRGYLVPNELFYVRNHTATPKIARKTWRLRVEGSGVARPREFTYDELLSLPSVSIIRALECAGNGRSFFESVQGKLHTTLLTPDS